MFSRTILCIALALASLGPTAFIRAGDEKETEAKVTVTREHVTSENFVFYVSNGGSPKLAGEVIKRAEAYRAKAFKLWAPDMKPAKWSCNVMLYDNRIQLPDGVSVTGSYTQELDPGKKFVACRTIRLDTSKRIGRDFKTHELPHEVNHAVIADIFFPHPVPRWADEGMAMMAEEDSGDVCMKQLVKRTSDKKRKFAAVEILDLRVYPTEAAKRMEFYELGLAVTRYLIEKEDRKTFVKFIKASKDGEVVGALKKVYGFKSATDFQKQFDEYLANQKK